jgi:hypothetical protein
VLAAITGFIGVNFVGLIALGVFGYHASGRLTTMVPPLPDSGTSLTDSCYDA